MTTGLTAKTIRPVVAGVGYHVNRTPRAEEFAQIDEQLAAYGADKVGGFTLANTVWSLAQDPDNPSNPPSITSGFTVTGAGSVFGTGSAGTYSIRRAPQYSAPRTRVIQYSPLEAMRIFAASTRGTTPVVDPSSGGLTQTIESGANDPFYVPLAKPMDGATVTGVRVYFIVPSQPSTNTGAGSVTLALSRATVATAPPLLSSTVGYNTISTPAPATWFNGGKPQYIEVTTSSGSPSGGTVGPLGSSGTYLAGPGSNILALSTYDYYVTFQGPTTNSSGLMPNPILTGVQITYSFTDERFPL